MSSTINASTTGVGGIITTADASGSLNIQSGGTTVVAVTSTGAAVTGTLSATGAVSGTTGTFTGAVSGTTGTFTGAVSGTTGTFTGAVSGTTGTFTGVSTFPAGTALLPAITTTGDTNTGMWFPAADTVAVSTSGAEAVRIDSSSNLKFNSGYGSVATAYGCRAWVNFNGTGNGTFAGGTSTVSRPAGSTTATVTTATSHGLITGNSVWALTGVVAGAYTVTVLTTNTFTITTAATTVLTNVAITFAVNTIRASGNVSSITDNGLGNYTVNFANAMPDANYAVISSASASDSNNDNGYMGVRYGTTPTTTEFRLGTDGRTSGEFDPVYAYVSVFR